MQEAAALRKIITAEKYFHVSQLYPLQFQFACRWNSVSVQLLFCRFSRKLWRKKDSLRMRSDCRDMNMKRGIVQTTTVCSLGSITREFLILLMHINPRKVEGFTRLICLFVIQFCKKFLFSLLTVRWCMFPVPVIWRQCWSVMTFPSIELKQQGSPVTFQFQIHFWRHSSCCSTVNIRKKYTSLSIWLRTLLTIDVANNWCAKVCSIFRDRTTGR